MDIENIDKKQLKKEYKTMRKLLAASMKKAGVAGSEVKLQLKFMDKNIREGAAEEKRYRDAMECIETTYSLLDQMCVDADLPDLTPVRREVEGVKSNLKQAGKAYFSDIENIWYQALVRLTDTSDIFLQDRIRPAKDPRAEDLRVAATSLKERIQGAIPTEEPDFYSAVAEVPGLLTNVRRGIETNDRKYAGLKQAAIERIQSVRPRFTYELLKKPEVMSAATLLKPALALSVDPMAEVPETEALTLPQTLKEWAKQYFPLAKANAKEQKRYDKAVAKREKQLAKGKEVPEVAPANLADIGAIRDKMLGAMDGLSERYQQEIEALQTKDYETAARNMLEYFEKHHLGIIA